MTAPERRGPERSGPDYPPEWDQEPAEPEEDDGPPCTTCDGQGSSCWEPCADCLGTGLDPCWLQDHPERWP